jgi:ankyrin repeat protein
VDPNAAEVDGTTALHWAVRNGDATLVDRLLRAGAKGHRANRYGVTPLPLACEQGDPAIVERLLKAGASANLTGPQGETALHTCARAGHVAAAKVLVTHGASLNAIESWRGQTPIMWAAAQGHAEMVSMLAEAWRRRERALGHHRVGAAAHVGAARQVAAARRVHAAAVRRAEGRVDAAKALIAAGADVSVVDPDRQSALVIALINGHFDVANLLIDHGADVNVPDKVGRTALWAAVDYHTPAAVQPAGAESVRRGDDQPRRHQEPARARRARRRGAHRADSLPDQARSRRRRRARRRHHAAAARGQGRRLTGR